MNLRKINSYPILQEVLYVQKIIKEHDGEFKIARIKKELSPYIMGTKLPTILDYLLHTNKISIDAEGKIGWIYYPKTREELNKYKHLFHRKIV